MTHPVGGDVPSALGDERGSMAHLERARRNLQRLTPVEAYAAQQRGAVIVDTRTSEQRARTAEIPGALVIDRTVLEWRLDPTFPWRIAEATSWETQYIVVCRHGYSSSVAAKALQDVGLVNATDVIGGFEAWVAAGLPTTHDPADVRE
ncbi:rhodanese-like domain-containing protein [Dermacoccus abyssi]|uniref:rhodanese-like domain-containing protein n=1 Tax=Dermacoccus abyssi TaxID=322596 RepID=UPI0021A8B3D2|nr:rhodanese-like domain-containing protein [Dermacoccus abyssi]MCT1988040.1 rhodanese-like domain-containing protein [Dermacoccus abyssi]